MGKPDAPPAPDYKALERITKKQLAQNEQLFNEFMDFQKGVYEDQSQRAERQYELLRPEIEGQIELSQKQRERYLEQGLPFEDQFLSEIQDYGSPEMADRRAGTAIADVTQAFQAQRENALRQLESYGIDPSQTRTAALDNQMRMAEAAAQAGAGTTAREQVDREGLALKADAVNLYRGLPASSAAALGAGSQTGQAGLAGTGQAGQLGMAGYGTGADILGQGSNIATRGWNTMNNIYGNQLQAWETEMANSPMNTIGGLFGTWMGAGFPTPFEEGGPVLPEMSPSGGAIPDDVPARLSAGEHVLSDDVVRYHGLKHIQKLENEAKEAMGIPEAG